MPIEIYELCLEVLQIMVIEVLSNDINVGFQKYSTTITEMVNNYLLCTTELTPVKTKIIVSDE